MVEVYVLLCSSYSPWTVNGGNVAVAWASNQNFKRLDVNPFVLSCYSRCPKASCETDVCYALTLSLVCYAGGAQNKLAYSNKKEGVGSINDGAQVNHDSSEVNP